MFRGYKAVRSNAELQRKLVLTGAVLFSYILQGWSEQQLGVALSSLQTLIGVDKEQISLILVGWCVGYVIGSITSGILFDKYNRLVLMFVLTIGLAVTTAILPFCPSLILMIACNFLTGIFNGGSDTGSNTIIPTVWQDECGPFEQLLYVCYAIGGIISPFITIPFMSEQSEEGPKSLSNSTIDLTNSAVLDSEKQIHIYPAFLITSGLFVLCSIPYMVMRFSGRYNNLAGRTVVDDESGDEDPIKHVHFKILICLMGMIYAMSVAAEDNLSTYLVSFTLEFLHWSELDAATITSSYWIASCCMGILGIFVVKILDYSTVLWVAVVLVNCSLGTVILGYFIATSSLVWLGFISCAAWMIFIIPTVFSWSQKYACEITGKVSSVFTVSAGISSATSSYLIGFMFDKFSKMYFVYILQVSTVLCLICYLLAYCLRFKCKRRCLSSSFDVEERKLDLESIEDNANIISIAIIMNNHFNV